MKAVIFIAAAALISLNAHALTPDYNLDSIAPIPGTDQMLLKFSGGMGHNYEYKDDDGLATLISVNYMISWERSVALEEDEWDDIKGADAAYYDVARPLLIQQLRRLSANFAKWSKAETQDKELSGEYQVKSEKLSAWAKKFADNAVVSNEVMNDFTSYLESFAADHSYQESEDGKPFKAGATIFGGSSDVGIHHSGLESNCASATNGDLESLVKSAFAGAKPEDILKTPAGTGVK